MLKRIKYFTLNFMRRPSAASPRSRLRPSIIASMLPPLRTQTTLYGTNYWLIFNI